MAADLRQDASHLLGLILGLWIYGMYTVLFIATLMIMNKRSYSNKFVWGALVSLWLLCTGNAGLSTARVYQAFVRDREVPGTLVNLKDFTNAISPARDIFYAFSILISDSLLLWRLRMVWQRNNWVFWISLTLVVCSYVCGLISAGYEIALAVSANEDKFKSKMEAWAGATFGLVLLGNLVINGLMAGRLWWFHRKMAPGMQKRSKGLYERITIVTLESGAIYSAFMIIPVIMFAAGATNAVQIPIYCLPAVVGCVPTLMILRLNWEPIRAGHNTVTAAAETTPTVRWAAPSTSALSANNHGIQSDPRGSRIPPVSFGDDPDLAAFKSYNETMIEQDSGSDRKSDSKCGAELEKVPSSGPGQDSKSHSLV